MRALPVAQAAAVLRVRPGTLRRWVREGCPVVARGRRGRGCAVLVDPEAVRAWRGANAVDAVVLELAATLPDVLADAATEAHRQIDGPIKTAAAGILAGAWFVAACAALDHLRQRCTAVPEIERTPEAIERLRKIAKGV